MAQRIPSNSSIDSSSYPQESSTPHSSPKRVIPQKRMSLQQKVLTYNAIKALTPKETTTETSYSKTKTATTKIVTADRTEESITTSVVEKINIIKKNESPNTHELNKSSKITSEKSLSSYSGSDIVSDKYINSSYKEFDLSDSVFQSDGELEQSKAVEEEYIEMETSTEEDENKQNEEVKTENATNEPCETETDPTLNIYEFPEESPDNENVQESDTVLTEMPIMSHEQYSAMEENDFDELHEEYFDEELIVQEYLSPSFKGTVTPDNTIKTKSTASEVIEIDSSSGSVSERENAVESNESSRINSSSSNSSIEKSYSESESENSDDEEVRTKSTELTKVEVVVEEVVDLDLTDDSKECNNSSSETDLSYEAIFDQDTQEAMITDDRKSNNKELSKQFEVEGSSNKQEVTVTTQSDEVKRDQKVISKTLESNEDVEVIECVVVEPNSTVQQDEKVVEKTNLTPTKEIEIKEQQIEVTYKQNESVDKENKLPFAENEQRNSEIVFVAADTSVDNKQKSDLEFSVVSDISLNRTSGAPLDNADLSYSIETLRKSDLDFSLVSNEDSRVHISSTPNLEKTTTPKGSEEEITNLALRKRSRSVSNMTPDATWGRRLRKRSSSVESTDDSSKSRKKSTTAKLPAILEEDKEVNIQSKKRQRQPKRAQSTSGALPQKRFTRRQNSLLEKAITASGYSSDSEDGNRGPALDPIDPLQLLHKSSFKGTLNNKSILDINMSF